MWELQSVSKAYLGSAPVLDSIQLQLKQGDFLYVVGGSGAGKTSLLRILATLDSPSTGQIKAFGKDLGQASSTELQQVRRHLGYIPQFHGLLPDLTLEDNVLIGAEFSFPSKVGAGMNPREKEKFLRGRMLELFEKLGLSSKRKEKVKNLSGGEAQRANVVRALIRNPSLIVADEPTGAQDKEYTWQLLDLFLKANQAGSTVVLATHDREMVRKVRKKCAILHQGHMKIEDALCGY